MRRLAIAAIDTSRIGARMYSENRTVTVGFAISKARIAVPKGGVGENPTNSKIHSTSGIAMLMTKTSSA